MSSKTMKACFNTKCKEVTDNCRRGWRRRTGDYACLCDGCASAHEDGKFCETFHLNDPGWRCCESCGKQIHCGCIVSFHMFVLLDAGGIECLTCARKSYILTPNPAWPPPSHFIPSLPERMKDLCVNNWSQIAGSGPLPWRQAPSLFRNSEVESDVPLKPPFDFDVLGAIGRPRPCERLCTSSCEMKQGAPYERLADGNMKTSSFKISGNFGVEMKEQPEFLENYTMLSTNGSVPTNMCLTSISPKSKKGDLQFSTVNPQKKLISTSVNQVSQLDTSGEGEMHSAKCGGVVLAQLMPLPLHGPKITEEALQHISDKVVITPLFEKMLSASDAGRIGRLVLPKKCAEAYFPPISCPEGLPLKVMDVKGKEWVFQFRFWPNNNSRMYVLEGISPCIQSLQLQAGDTVIFSRLEPEGKLIMGGRRASAFNSAEQRAEWTTVSTDTLASSDGSAKNKTGFAISTNSYVRVSEKVLEDDAIVPIKRKIQASNAKNKRHRMEVEIKLRFNLKEAQQLMRLSTKTAPNILVVEGYEFEEFESHTLVIGRPTIPGIDHLGENILWVECEECCKWCKVPTDALLSSRWICCDNSWDAYSSLYPAAEELSRKHLEQMLQSMEKDYPKKDRDPERLDEHMNLAIRVEGDSVPASSKSIVSHQHSPIKKVFNHKHKSTTLADPREQRHCERRTEPSFPSARSSLIQEINYHDEAVGRRSSSVSPLKCQIDLNIKPDRDEELWVLDQ